MTRARVLALAAVIAVVVSACGVHCNSEGACITNKPAVTEAP